MDTNQDFKGFYRENKSLLREYIDLRMRLWKRSGIRSASRIVSFFALFFLLALMSLFVLIFLGLSLSAWLSELLGSVAFAHLLTALIYLLLMVIAIAFRKPLFLNPFIRLFIGAADEETKPHDSYGKDS